MYSSIAIVLNNTKYKRGASKAPLLLNIVDKDVIKIEELKNICSDQYFDQNLKFLIENGFETIKQRKNNENVY